MQRFLAKNLIDDGLSIDRVVAIGGITSGAQELLDAVYEPGPPRDSLV